MFCVACLACNAAGAAEDSLRSCLSGLRGQAIAAGVAGAAYDGLTVNLTRDASVIEASENQPEFRLPAWEYLAPLVDEERIGDGRARLEQWASVLLAAERRSGVSRYILLAVWGVESDYGRFMGDKPLLRSLATLSCEGRRQSYFRGELFRALRIVIRGDISPERLLGSWAGAFGQTQFMPSNYFEDAIDEDGDGKIDLVDSVPDALGSAGMELAHSGWNRALLWGYEVKLPRDFDGGLAGRRNKQAYADWVALGVRRADGAKLPSEGSAGLILPSGKAGPAFLVTRNFDALFAYNASEFYALAIAHLADRIAGGRPFVTPWPTNDRGLSRAERRELQTLLLARGYDIGAADGLIGTRTRAAIGEYQVKIGLGKTSRATGLVLDALRAGK